MPGADNAHTENATISKGVRRMLGQSLEWWNAAMIIALIVAALGALATAVTTTVVVKMTAEGERESKRALEEYKVNAGEQIAAANAMGETAKADAALANERAKEMERGNLELRSKLAGRRVTAEQHKILVEELAKIPAHFDVAVMQDPESVMFALDVEKTLADAGWIRDQRETPISEFWTGLVLLQTDDPAGLRLLEALQKSGLSFGIGDDAYKREKATLMVGSKPAAF
jgi:hypothetical protein